MSGIPLGGRSFDAVLSGARPWRLTGPMVGDDEAADDGGWMDGAIAGPGESLDDGLDVGDVRDETEDASA